MQSYAAPEYGLWYELVLVLTAGTAVIVALAALAGRSVRSAVWRRTVWQVATLGLLALVLVELTGTGGGLLSLWPAARQTSNVETLVETAVAPGNPMPQPPAATVELVAAEDLGAFQERELPPAVAQWELLPHVEELEEADSSGPVATDFVLFAETAVDGSHDDEYRYPFATAKAAAAAIENPAVFESEVAMARRKKSAAFIASCHSECSQESPCSREILRCAQDDVGAVPGHGWWARHGWWPGLIWGLGAVLIAGRIVSARALLVVFRWRHAGVPDEILYEHVGILARRLGIRRPVCVLEAAGLRAPVAFGSFRPTIALPAGFVGDFSRRQQEAMLAHELAHLAAFDPAWQLLADLLCAVLWWHPLAWWSRRRLKAAGEMAADEASLLIPDGPDVLAGCLVAMGRRLTGRRQLGWLSIGGPGFRSGLGRRVQRLLSLRSRSWQAPGRRRLAFVKTALPVTLVIVAVLSTAWVRPQAISAEGGTTMHVLTSSWRHSLAAVAFVALWSTASSEAVADQSPTGEPTPAVASDKLPDAGLLALQEEGEEREREGGEAKEREKQEREGGEAEAPEEKRGDAERRERPEGERREAEQRERPEGEQREQRERREGERREAEQREGEQRERRVRELRQEHGELEERAAAIKREMEGLRDGQDAEAREIQAALGEIQGRMAQIRRELGGGEPDRPDRPRPDQPDRPRPGRPEREGHFRELRGELGRLEEKAQAIKRELGDRGPDHDDQAHQLHAQLGEIHGRMEQIRRELGGPQPDPDRPRPDRERLAGRLEELKRAIGRLMEEGKRDEANRLEREAHEILQLLKQEPRGPRDRPPAPAEDLERRIHHVKVAIENLHAAGLHDVAERLAQDLDRRIAEHRERFGGLPEPPRPPERRERPEPPGPVVEELRGQMNELRREVEELRRLLKEVLDRQGQRR